MKRYFITATGTDIGKTFVTVTLAWQLRAQGIKVKATKPVISGFDERNPAGSDSERLLAAQGLNPAQIDLVSPWRFAAPLSPDMAAKIENREISLTDIAAFCEAPADPGVMLIEGVGGVMSPLTERRTVLDLLEMLNIPVILVAGSYVGTISHTLTALHSLAGRSQNIHSIIVNETPGSAASLEQTRESLYRHTGDTVPIHPLQRLDSGAEIWKNAPNLIEGLV